MSTEENNKVKRIDVTLKKPLTQDRAQCAVGDKIKVTEAQAERLKSSGHI